MAAIPLEGLRSVRGQPGAVAFLAHVVATGRLASAYLFEGPDGVGKERTARALAQVTVCLDKRDDGDACGHCASCRAVAADRYVDLITVARTIDVETQQELSASETKSELTIDKIRDLQTKRLVYQSHQGARWVIVRDAEQMNANASNAFLKTLEEPPANTYIVLVSSRPSRLLGTIRSRCQRVRFTPLDTPTVRALLVESGTDPEVAARASSLADGSLANAALFADAEALGVRQAKVDRVVAALRAGRPGAYVDAAEELKELAKRDEFELGVVLRMLERHFRSDAVAYAGAHPRRAVAAACRADLVRETTESLDRNLNAQMAFENMLVRLREVRG